MRCAGLEKILLFTALLSTAVVICLFLAYCYSMAKTLQKMGRHKWVLFNQMAWFVAFHIFYALLVPLILSPSTGGVSLLFPDISPIVVHMIHQLWFICCVNSYVCTVTAFTYRFTLTYIYKISHSQLFIYAAAVAHTVFPLPFLILSSHFYSYGHEAFYAIVIMKSQDLIDYARMGSLFAFDDHHMGDITPFIFSISTLILAVLFFMFIACIVRCRILKSKTPHATRGQQTLLSLNSVQIVVFACFQAIPTAVIVMNGTMIKSHRIGLVNLVAALYYFHAPMQLGVTLFMIRPYREIVVKMIRPRESRQNLTSVLEYHSCSRKR